MTDHFIKSLKIFCKSCITVGRPISVIHKEYISWPCHPTVPIDMFEQGLKALNKTVIKNLEKECVEYISVQGNNYNNFINEKQFVTKKFWEEALKKVQAKQAKKGINPHSEKISKSCETIHKNPSIIVQEPTTAAPKPDEKAPPEITLLPEEDLNVIKTLASISGQLPENFPNYWKKQNNHLRKQIIMKVLDPTILEIMMKKIKKPIIVNMARDRWNELMAPEKSAPGMKRYGGMLPEGWATLHWVRKEKFIAEITDPDFLKSIISIESVKAVITACKKRLTELTKAVKNTVEPVPEKAVQIPVPEKVPEKAPKASVPSTELKDELPINWNELTRAERIDFVRKIKGNKKLFKHILSIDSEVAAYIDKLKNNNDPGMIKTNLYICLFSAPSLSTSNESKTLLKSFVEALNRLGRARLEYAELIDPPVIEIREIRR